MNDPVSYPAHYTQGGIEAIQAIEASMTADEFLGWLKGNILKYLWRWRHKGGAQDLAKAQFYLGVMIERAKREEAEKAKGLAEAKASVLVASDKLIRGSISAAYASNGIDGIQNP
jgi:hypothetical protein